MIFWGYLYGQINCHIMLSFIDNTANNTHHTKIIPKIAAIHM